jgi:predicted nucleotidyltransferase
MLDREATKSWIETTLRRRDTVERFYFFGSFTTPSRKIGDIDILVIFSTLDQYEFLIETSRNFRDKFEIPLHIQSFHIDQTEEIDNFLKRANINRDDDGKGLTLFNNEVS